MKERRHETRMGQNMSIFSSNLAILHSPTDQERSLEVTERKAAENSGEQLGGKLVDVHNHWASSNSLHRSDAPIFSCGVAPWSTLATACSIVCCRAESW